MEQIYAMPIAITAHRAYLRSLATPGPAVTTDSTSTLRRIARWLSGHRPSIAGDLAGIGPAFEPAAR
jgi:hypothetical protein